MFCIGVDCVVQRLAARVLCSSLHLVCCVAVCRSYVVHRIVEIMLSRGFPLVCCVEARRSCVVWRLAALVLGSRRSCSNYVFCCDSSARQGFSVSCIARQHADYLPLLHLPYAERVLGWSVEASPDEELRVRGSLIGRIVIASSCIRVVGWMFGTQRVSAKNS
jgi:hypothetical protein